MNWAESGLWNVLLNMEKGWRIGWDPEAPNYKGLVGGEDWAFELTESELNDFCRLLVQLAQTMSEMASELMDEEKITCEAESDWLWMEGRGLSSAYTLRLILIRDAVVRGAGWQQRFQGC